MHDNLRVRENRNAVQVGITSEDVAHLIERLNRIERVLEEGFGAVLNAKYPHGDGYADDRWGRQGRYR